MPNVSGSPDVIIVGGGVAGLSTARVLAERRLRVLLVEAAPALASQASGNNAAIFRPLEEDAASAVLPRRSRELLAQWFDAPLLDGAGLLLVSDRERGVRELAAVAHEADVPYDVVTGRALRDLAPSLAGGAAEHALLLREGGVLDVPALTNGLAQQARAGGAELRTGRAVRALTRTSDRIEGVVLEDGTRIHAPDVIVCAGAWNARLGDAIDAPMPLAPLRRHLVELHAAATIAAPEPVVWRLEDEVYYRRLGRGVLASPCDETATTPAECVEADPGAVQQLQQKLSRVAPVLAVGSIARAWACLRTFAPDRELVVGRDPRVRGLHWFGGLGGRGMCVALAAAEGLAAGMLGEMLPPRAAALLPARLLSSPSSADRTA